MPYVTETQHTQVADIHIAEHLCVRLARSFFLFVAMVLLSSSACIMNEFMDDWRCEAVMVPPGFMCIAEFFSPACAWLDMVIAFLWTGAFFIMPARYTPSLVSSFFICVLSFFICGFCAVLIAPNLFLNGYAEITYLRISGSVIQIVGALVCLYYFTKSRRAICSHVA